DAGRSALAPLVPSVIGLTGDDPRVDARLALRAARVALPVAAADRQRVLAVSILAAERALADAEGRPAGSLTPESREVLAQVPHAADWARRFTREVGASSRGFRRHAAPNTIRYAVVGIAEACTNDPDRLLRDLLAGAIDDCRRLLGRDGAPAVDRDALAEDCRTAGVP